MTTLEIGTKLVALVRAGKNPEAIESLYDPSVISVEAGAPPGQSREATGIPADVWRRAIANDSFDVLPMTPEQTERQQRVADRFRALNLIPVDIKVADIVWQRGGRA